jgi:hypothetical protein
MLGLLSALNGLENFNGNISEWDVSKVTDMSHMFFKSKFNKNISIKNI